MAAVEGSKSDRVENRDAGASYPPALPAVFTSVDALKGRIREHYEVCSDYYYSLWGEHIHHGYFLRPDDTKELAQLQLIKLLLQRSALPKNSKILDVGCGLGGTTRYLAREHGCSVTGITISGNQVKLARKLSMQEKDVVEALAGEDFLTLGNGKVRFIELDAEVMGDFFNTPPNALKFDAVWISEALSHLPNKELFFHNSFALLDQGGKLVIADWFKSEQLTPAEMRTDIKPIEDGMLLPPLCTQSDYVNFAKEAGFTVSSEPFDISKDVAKTWDISLSLVQSPSLWALAFTQGRDFLAFLQAFRAMKRGYANGTFRYAVMVFQK